MESNSNAFFIAHENTRDNQIVDTLKAKEVCEQVIIVEQTTLH